MDDVRFDTLARRAAASRRGLLSAIAAALLAGNGAPAVARTRKRNYGEPCAKGSPCRSRVCVKDGRCRRNGVLTGRCTCGCADDGDCGASFRCGSGGLCEGCGERGDPCCASGSCRAGNFCGDDGICAPCGASGLVCCPENTCDGPGLICEMGICETCGRRGEPCCVGERCDTDRLVCQDDGLCTDCGGDRDLCCAGETCREDRECNPDSDRCLACGGRFQACCETGDECDQTGVPKRCESGVCVPQCGIAERECCPGGECVAGNNCRDLGGGLQICEPCGAENEECCPNGECESGSTCREVGGGFLVCTACGNEHEECCPGEQCATGSTCQDVGGGPLICIPDPPGGIATATRNRHDPSSGRRGSRRKR